MEVCTAPRPYAAIATENGYLFCGSEPESTVMLKADIREEISSPTASHSSILREREKASHYGRPETHQSKRRLAKQTRKTIRHMH